MNVGECFIRGIDRSIWREFFFNYEIVNFRIGKMRWSCEIFLNLSFFILGVIFTWTSSLKKYLIALNPFSFSIKKFQTCNSMG